MLGDVMLIVLLRAFMLSNGKLNVVMLNIILLNTVFMSDIMSNLKLNSVMIFTSFC
jgi:hypothetical protein